MPQGPSSNGGDQNQSDWTGGRWRRGSGSGIPHRSRGRGGGRDGRGREEKEKKWMKGGKGNKDAEVRVRGRKSGQLYIAVRDDVGESKGPPGRHHARTGRRQARIGPR
ncbi:hypothetical protein I7I51_02002 [Histoplasma capsulatum]|uniref:Uncharacterized protein n=1 Tax=Ajellomyces capsulatus TaxID=5037 RepID=A0A8A1MLH3_AJECA|nr:hypothetical protein I7I51_02002 [Histoplasma capsulatum]